MTQRKKDFYKDGILHCGQCGKPKYVRYDLFGEVRMIPCLCDCDAKKRKEEHDAFLNAQRLIKIDDMRVNNIQDREIRKCRFEGAEITDEIIKCKAYADHWNDVQEKNAGLLMYGNCGSGKSFAAACIANALTDKGIPTLMTSFPAILDDASNTTDIARQMQEFDLVVLDDLGAERQSQYALEKVFYVIDERYKSGRPLIVTTNQKLEYMQMLSEDGEADYKRIYDRVLAMCVPMAFKGQTRRKPIRQEKIKFMKEMVGKEKNEAGRKAM